MWAASYVDSAILLVYGYHMPDNTKTTVYLDEAEYRRLKALADAQGRPAAALVREAVSFYVAERAGVSRPSSIGIARSGRDDLSERVDELLDGFGRS